MSDWWTRLLVAVGLAAAPGAPMSQAEPLFPEAIQAPDMAPANRPLTITVTGNLPTPAYEVLPPQVTVTPPTVHIRLGAKLKHSGPSIQMLQPFSVPVQLPPLAAGAYELVVESPNAEPIRRPLSITAP